MFVRKDLNLGKIFSVAIRNCAIQTATTVSIAKELSNACDRMLPHTNYYKYYNILFTTFADIYSNVVNSNSNFVLQKIDNSSCAHMFLNTWLYL